MMAPTTGKRPPSSKYRLFAGMYEVSSFPSHTHTHIYASMNKWSTITAILHQAGIIRSTSSILPGIARKIQTPIQMEIQTQTPIQIQTPIQTRIQIQIQMEIQMEMERGEKGGWG